MFVTRLIDKLTNGVKSTINCKSANHHTMTKMTKKTVMLLFYCVNVNALLQLICLVNEKILSAVS